MLDHNPLPLGLVRGGSYPGNVASGIEAEDLGTAWCGGAQRNKRFRRKLRSLHSCNAVRLMLRCSLPSAHCHSRGSLWESPSSPSHAGLCILHPFQLIAVWELCFSKEIQSCTSEPSNATVSSCPDLLLPGVSLTQLPDSNAGQPQNEDAVQCIGYIVSEMLPSAPCQPPRTESEPMLSAVHLAFSD